MKPPCHLHQRIGLLLQTLLQALGLLSESIGLQQRIRDLLTMGQDGFDAAAILAFEIVNQAQAGADFLKSRRVLYQTAGVFWMSVQKQLPITRK